VVEVTEKAKRRQHSAAYKLKVLQEADGCKKPGELGALLRREGLYSSHLAAWRAARAKGGDAGLAAVKRGPKAVAADARDKQLIEQQRELAHWKARAERAEAVVEIQKKVAVLLGIDPPESSGRRG
jgi:transposase-like protein